MKKYIIAVAMTVSGAVYAQDSYDAANFATKDLNGTARFVSMGGALSALGGDISVMSTNPAGTAMYKKADAAFTFSDVVAKEEVLGHDKTGLSIDNGGIVFTLPVDEGNVKFVNFGVNYVKGKNFLFNQSTAVENLNSTFSQTFQIANLANQAYNNNNWGNLANMSAPIYKDGILSKSGLVIENYDNDNKFIGYSGISASKANLQKATYGGNTQADINVSFNVLDKYFFGASVGLYDINYSRESFYEELGTDGKYYDFSNWYTTDGDGFDVKLGFICRPIDESPFRFGITIHTPTWYRMEDVNGSVLYLNDTYIDQKVTDPYDYNYRTPWKFGFSLGYTVDNYFAIGAEYEYQDLSTCHYSWEGYQTNYFQTQNKFIKNNLQGQSTFKVGMEVKPASAFSIRAGYNFVSAPFKNNAYRIIAYDGPFTETDFTNWKETNRFTFGIGYRYKGGYVDFAYQYTAQKGDFYAFDETSLKPTDIENNRSQIMCTLGFRF